MKPINRERSINLSTCSNENGIQLDQYYTGLPAAAYLHLVRQPRIQFPRHLPFVLHAPASEIICAVIDAPKYWKRPPPLPCFAAAA